MNRRMALRQQLTGVVAAMVVAALVSTTVAVNPSSAAPSSQPAFTLTATGNHNNLSSSYVVGYEFTVNSEIVLTDLGLFDQDQDGRLNEPTAPPVGVWNAAGALLASTTIPLGTTAEANVFYRSINHVTLQPGVYTIGVLNYAGGERFTYDTTVTSPPEISFGQGRFIKSTNLVFPTQKRTTLAAYFGPNFKFSTAPANENLSLSTPTSPSIYQQQDGRGQIPIAGTAVGADEVQARALAVDGGVTTDWRTVDSSIGAGGAFAGSLEASVGWYRIEVRSSTGENISVDRIGVGDNYLMAGQSNSANYGQSRQAPSDGRVLALRADGRWAPAVDPQPRASGTKGSPWPAMGDALAAYSDGPVGVVSTGQGSTTVGGWVNSLFSSRLAPAIAAAEPYGFKAILWHQGESDSLSNTSAQVYAQQLASVIASSRRSAGFDVPWYVATASYHPSSSEAAEAPIRQGQGLAVASDPLVFAGPDTDSFVATGLTYDGVHFSNEGLRRHGQLWADILERDRNLRGGPGQIAGVVSFAEGGATGEVQVDLFRSVDGQRSDYLRSAITDSAGRYSFTTDAGPHIVTFIAPDGEAFVATGRYFQTELQVVADETLSGINAQLLGGGVEDSATIGGTIFGISNRPEAGVAVDLFAAQADGSRGQFLSATTTDNSGEYRFSGPAACYVVTMIAPDNLVFSNGRRWNQPSICVDPGGSVTNLDGRLTAP
ncbi:MAG: sialate O-acetylesterase [Acidimicrobiales bacterium]